MKPGLAEELFSLYIPGMPPRNLLLSLLICAGSLCISFTLLAQEYRTFTNAKGQSVKARVLSVDRDQARIALENGTEFSISVYNLSPGDQEYLKSWSPQSSTPLPSGGVEARKLNEAIGQPLFADKRLWDSAPAEVAERLNWPRESKTEISESYRAYPGKDYRFLGARPYSAALYGEHGKVTSISIVFANKGDSFRALGSGEKHFIKGEPVPEDMEGVKMIMANDADTIAETLTALLGASERQKFGEGESRVEVHRWDWAGHALLLSHVEEEYVSLAIETTEAADARGRNARISDATIRDRIRGFVQRRENGDVVITNIPMVDQGPKGYCVPATAERCMRFLGIPADMYLLAMVGETDIGGGTSVDLLLSNIGRDIKRKGRSFEIESGELKMRDIKRSIDDGIPVIWAIQSTEEFNDIATARTESRQSVPWADYKATAAAAAEKPQLFPADDRGHVVIIIGYNEETNEIAFSDSWGERFQERWITIPEGEIISQKRFYIIGL